MRDKEWGLARDLRTAFERELKALSAGESDRIFSAAAAVVESGQLVGAGEALSCWQNYAGVSKTQVFRKGACNES